MMIVPIFACMNPSAVLELCVRAPVSLFSTSCTRAMPLHDACDTTPVDGFAGPARCVSAEGPQQLRPFWALLDSLCVSRGTALNAPLAHGWDLGLLRNPGENRTAHCSSSCSQDAPTLTIDFFLIIRETEKAVVL